MNKFSMILLSAGVLVACGGDECEKAADRQEAAYLDCDIDLGTSSTTGTATGTTEAECTDADAEASSCMADCYEAADCAALDGSDAELDSEHGTCLFECLMTSTSTGGPTPTPTPTGT